MSARRTQLLMLAALLAVAFVWWAFDPGTAADDEGADLDAAEEEARPTLTGKGMAAGDDPEGTDADGAAKGANGASGEGSGLEKPGFTVKLDDQSIAPPTEASLRSKGFNQKVEKGELGGVVVMNNEGVTEGEALVWKVSKRIATARGIPVAKEPDHRIAIGRDGRFRISDLEPGAYLIGVMLPDGTPRLLWNTLDLTRERDEELIVIGNGVIAGRVYDNTGAYAEGWRVRVSNSPGHGIQTLISETAVEPDGTFRIEGLITGSYWVSVHDPKATDDVSGVTRSTEVVNGKTTEVTFGSPDPVRLRGTVRFGDGVPVRGPGRIVAYQPDMSMAIIQYDERGTFDHQLEKGTWTFRFDFSHRHRSVLVTAVELSPENATQDLGLPCARIEGRVLHDGSVTPLYVRIWPADGRWQDGDAVVVARDGTFYMPGVKPGRWHLRAETQNKTDAETVLIEVREGDALRTMDLRL